MSITNDQRAAWAGAGLLAYATGKEGGEELYDEAELVLSDMLTDLMHYAERRGIAFHTCIDRATTHYHEERAEEHGAAGADLLAAAPAGPEVLHPYTVVALHGATVHVGHYRAASPGAATDQAADAAPAGPFDTIAVFPGHHDNLLTATKGDPS